MWYFPMSSAWSMVNVGMSLLCGSSLIMCLVEPRLRCVAWYCDCSLKLFTVLPVPWVCALGAICSGRKASVRRITLQAWRCYQDVKPGWDEVSPCAWGHIFVIWKPVEPMWLQKDNHKPCYPTPGTTNQTSKPAFESSGVILFLGLMPEAGRKKYDL